MGDHTELMTLGICHRLPLHAVGGDGCPDPSRPQCLEMVNVANGSSGCMSRCMRFLPAFGSGTGCRISTGPGG